MIAGPITAAVLACSIPGRVVSTESPLNCLELFPTPDLPSASGSIALLPVPSPFGVAVTVDGRPRYRLSATITGLPDPRSLGDYTVYVAWASTVALDSAVNLGPVRNGHVDLGEISLVQFRILISAERSVTSRERRGRLVLRGTSPSARLLAHRDLVQVSGPGALFDTTRARGAPSTHDMAHPMPPGGAAVWQMPPMPPRMAMMPGMSGLVPNTEPFVPSMTAGVSAVRRDSRTVRLASGDTLSLEAGAHAMTIAGTAVVLYGYNGSTPGPLLEVKQFDTIVVRYHNTLEAPGSVHWHGVRLDNASDGAVGLTQQGIARAERFSYTLRFPDAGIFWYHPHAREDIQQALGLYGNVIVRSPDTAYYSPVNREEILVLSDVLVAEQGLVPFGTDAPTHALMGRFGNVLLVNGQPRYSLNVKRGEVVRFFLTNASSARIYNASFTGARMKLVAGDGGKFEREEWVESVVIAPSERYVIEVEFLRTGSVALVNRVQALDHMIGSYSREVDTLGVVRVADALVRKRFSSQFATLRTNRDVRQSLAPFRSYFEKPVDRELVLTLRTKNLPAAIAAMLQGINAPIEWNDGMPMMNWVTTSKEIEWVLRDPATGKENMDIDWRFGRGDVVKLRIFNDPSTSHAMAHPIHLHGQRFLVLTRDGVASQNLVWKDTAVIPAGETVEILADMSNPGRWMLHCHIGEHLSSGMMAAFMVN